MSKLTDLPNIGKTLAQKLQLVGIQNKEDLISIGAENAMIRIATIDKNACINMLYALEGAIQGVRWHFLNKERMNELNAFFQMICNK